MELSGYLVYKQVLSSLAFSSAILAMVKSDAGTVSPPNRTPLLTISAPLVSGPTDATFFVPNNRPTAQSNVFDMCHQKANSHAAHVGSGSPNIAHHHVSAFDGRIMLAQNGSSPHPVGGSRRKRSHKRFQRLLHGKHGAVVLGQQN
ncbi:hypothetical protein KL925_004931 [Ogataea polymorpha]|nr:hypothetical protein KL908_004858 [Ogataea polymorpha]KAG7924758.1 hypothetical protein KL925_004931 [Ogataea polymorpha]